MNGRCWVEVQKKKVKNATWQSFAFRTYPSTSPPAFHQLCSVSIIFYSLWLQRAGQVFSGARLTWELCSLHMNLRRLCLVPEKERQWVRGRDSEDRGGEPAYQKTFSCLHLKLFPKSHCLLQERGIRWSYCVFTFIVNFIINKVDLSAAQILASSQIQLQYQILAWR